MSTQTLEEIEHKSSVNLQAGFWEAFLGLALTGLGYIVYICCIAEMTS
eukprot:gene20489-15023_t